LVRDAGYTSFEAACGDMVFLPLIGIFDDVRGATLSTLVSLFDHRIDQAGGPDATQFKQKDSLLVEPLPTILVAATTSIRLSVYDHMSTCS
ncbi:hypothetical protein, partial [Salinibacter ruber]|uniref:hypothetical protein n=1 Tax=Salinibacter ruber TaxID=146919 RepID=UPI0020749E0A